MSVILSRATDRDSVTFEVIIATTRRQLAQVWELRPPPPDPPGEVREEMS